MTDTRRRNWDPLVKLTHWSVVFAVLVNAVVTEEGSNAHVWVGYGLAAVLGLRLLWGLVGPSEARFSAFPPSPRGALIHLRDIREGRKTVHSSHNPLGALMVYAIWSCLGAIIASGIAMSGLPGQQGQRRETAPVETSAPAHDARQSADVGGEREDEEQDEGKGEGEGEGEEEEGWLGETHEVFVNLLYLLILLHIAGVVFETRRSGRQIALAMLPGRR